MSGGVNVKSAPRAPSGIPLPRSLLPSSPKVVDPRRQTSSLPRPSSSSLRGTPTHTPRHTPAHTPRQTPTHTPRHTPRHTPTHTPAHSPTRTPLPSSATSSRTSGIPGAAQPSSKELLRDATVRNQLLQRSGGGGGLPVPQAQSSTQGSYNSPLLQRREQQQQRSRDAGLLDAPGKPAAATTNLPPHVSSTSSQNNGNRNRNMYANRNHLRPPLRRGDNTDNTAAREERGGLLGDGEDDRDVPPEEETLSMLSNDNLRPSPVQTVGHDPAAVRGRSGSTSQSDEEMGTPEDLSPASSPGPLPPPPMVLLDVPVAAKAMADNVQDPWQESETPPMETLTPRINMATVAPFRYRSCDSSVGVMVDSDVSVEELSDCSSGSIEVCCDDLTSGGMLGANMANVSMNAKLRELDLKSPASSSGQEGGLPAPRASMASSRKTPASKPSALPQGAPTARPSGGPELKVYRPATSGSIPIPNANPSRLRKQRSLSNLCVLTDAEKKLHLFQPPGWTDDMGRPATAGTNKTGQTKAAAGGGGRPPLCRTLSKSEQSLFQGKPKTPAVTPSLGKPSRIPAPGKPRGPYAEIKPISKTCESGSSSTDAGTPDHPAKAGTNGTGRTGGSGGKKTGDKGNASTPPVAEKKEGKGGVEGEEDKNFLKVDPELVVTVLGDLEQLLFSQILDPESQRKRTVQNVLDLRQNLEDTMTSLRGGQLSHSCQEGSMVCYDSDEAAAFSVSSLSNRSSPLSWRQGQASPRLQAGDAPIGAVHHTTQPLRISHTSRIHLIEGLEDSDPALLKVAYLSDSDLGGRSPNEDDEDDDDDDDDVDIDDLGNG